MLPCLLTVIIWWLYTETDVTVGEVKFSEVKFSEDKSLSKSLTKI